MLSWLGWGSNTPAEGTASPSSNDSKNTATNPSSYSANDANMFANNMMIANHHRSAASTPMSPFGTTPTPQGNSTGGNYATTTTVSNGSIVYGQGRPHPVPLTSMPPPPVRNAGAHSGTTPTQQPSCSTAATPLSSVAGGADAGPSSSHAVGMPRPPTIGGVGPAFNVANSPHNSNTDPSSSSAAGPTSAAAALLASLAATVQGLIDHRPIPKLAEAAVLVGKAKLLVEASLEDALLDRTRMIDSQLEEAIAHRDERNRLLRVAAERNALMRILKAHPLISYTPSITEERTAAIDGIVAGINQWIANKGGLSNLFSLGSSSSSASCCAALSTLRTELLLSAQKLEWEVGAVYGSSNEHTLSAATSSSRPPTLEMLSFTLLASLMIDINRLALTALTTFIVEDCDIEFTFLGGGGGLEDATKTSAGGMEGEGAGGAKGSRVHAVTPSVDDDLAAMLMLEAEGHGAEASQRPQQRRASSVEIAAPQTPPASFAFSGGVPPTSSTSQSVPPAKANRAFFATSPSGMRLASTLKDLIVVAKTVCGSGKVCEAVQAICAFKLAEVMAALDGTVSMEGVRRRVNAAGGGGACGGSRGRSASNANSSFASVSCSPTPTAAATGGGGGYATSHGNGGGRSVSPLSAATTVGGGVVGEIFFHCCISGLRLAPAPSSSLLSPPEFHSSALSPMAEHDHSSHTTPAVALSFPSPSFSPLAHNAAPASAEVIAAIVAKCPALAALLLDHNPATDKPVSGGEGIDHPIENTIAVHPFVLQYLSQILV